MPNKHKSKRSQPRRAPKQTAVIGGAPFLHKEHVTLTGIINIVGGSNGGSTYALINGNGILTNGSVSAVP